MSNIKDLYDLRNSFSSKSDEEVAAIVIQGCFKTFDINDFSYYYFCNVIAETVSKYEQIRVIEKNRAKSINDCISDLIQDLILKDKE